MSSARSNAAARARRAGGDMPPPQQMNGRPGQQMQQGQQMQTTPKLSISDAIGLITLRLGRVEQIIQNMPVDGALNNLDENVRIVDDVVITNIVQRLDALEKGHKVLAERKPSIAATPTVSATTTHVSQAVNAELVESVKILKAEMIQVKDLLLQLQSFTMQTNQRLSEIVFNNDDLLQNVEECDDIVSGNIVDDASAQALLGLQPNEEVALTEETISNPNEN